MHSNKEKRAIIEIVKLCFDNADIDKVKAKLDKCDEESLIELLTDTGISGFIHNKLCQDDKYNPFNLDNTRKLFQRSGVISIRNTIIRDNLMTLCTALNAKNIQYIILKGIPLIERVYSDETIRPTSDIDILINQEQYNEVQSVLDALNYRFPTKKMEKLSPLMTKEWVETKKAEIPFVKRDIPFDITVDLHFDMSLFHDNEFMNQMFDMDSYDFLNNTQIIDMDSFYVSCLNDEIEFIYSVYHYTIQHSFMGLKWLIDICYMITNDKFIINWDRVNELVSNPNLRHSLELCLVIVRDIIGRDAFVEHVDYQFKYPKRLVNYKSLSFVVQSTIKSKILSKSQKLVLPATLLNRFKMLRFYLFERNSIKHRIENDKSTRFDVFQPVKLLFVFVRELFK